jgi:hypothetical protein
MHEFEALVEQSVTLLSTSGREPAQLRSLYWNLYEFEAEWDTGFTHFRNIDDLLAVNFVYKMPLTEHPDYAEHRAYFDGLEEFTFIEEPSEDGGYTYPPDLYFDAGSPLWQRLVDLGRLTGPDTVPPEPIDLVEVAYAVASLAEQRGDRELIASWYRLMAPHVAFEYEPDELRANETLARLRDIVRRTDAMSVRFDYGIAKEDPDEQTLAEYPGLAWWHDLT